MLMKSLRATKQRSHELWVGKIASSERRVGVQLEDRGEMACRQVSVEVQVMEEKCSSSGLQPRVVWSD